MKTLLTTREGDVLHVRRKWEFTDHPPTVIENTFLIRADGATYWIITWDGQTFALQSVEYGTGCLAAAADAVEGLGLSIYHAAFARPTPTNGGFEGWSARWRKKLAKNPPFGIVAR